MPQKYGRNPFGQSCLVARRLIEKGVKFITINYGGWDTHKEHFEAIGRMLPQLDRGVASLVSDLSDRGLLDSTIVWCGGEFGRTPKVDWNPPWNGGRGHHGAVFSTLVAGGGFQGGAVLGKSDSKAASVEERPVYPWDLLGTMYSLLGIDPEDFEAVHKAMNTAIKPGFTTGQPLCKAAVDLACYDLTGKRLGKSAADLLGGGKLDQLTLSWTVASPVI